MSLCIMLLTAHRLDYAKMTLAALRNRMSYNGDVRLHIASDGDDSSYLRELALVWTGCLEDVSTSNSAGLGYGANFNAATQVIHQIPDVEYVLPLEDDWVLSREFDFTHLVSDMVEGKMDSIRLGYVGWTEDIFGKFVGVNGRCYLELMHWSNELHIFAGHPRLETVQYQREVGPWPEGLLPGETEMAMGRNERARKGVYWPVDEVAPIGNLFGHIGEQRSY